MAEEEEPERVEARSGMNNPFCPFCFMQQFEVVEGSGGSVYCEVCGIDLPIQDLVRL